MPAPRPRRTPALVIVALAVALTGCGERTEPRDPGEATTRTASATPVAPSPAADPPATTSFALASLDPAGRDEWLTEIPDGIALDVALPADGGDFTRGRSAIEFRFCDVEGFSFGDVLDRAAVSASGPEYGEGRELRVFASDRAAHHFLRHVVAVVQACPEQEEGQTTWRHELRPSHLQGDASFTAVQSFFDQDDLPLLGANFWEVVRVGNAVLLTATGGEYEPTTTLDRGIRQHAGDVAPLVDAMCVFADADCPG